jgi:hypothetical protein
MKDNPGQLEGLLVSFGVTSKTVSADANFEIGGNRIVSEATMSCRQNPLVVDLQKLLLDFSPAENGQKMLSPTYNGASANV